MMWLGGLVTSPMLGSVDGVTKGEDNKETPSPSPHRAQNLANGKRGSGRKRRDGDKVKKFPRGSNN